MNLDIEKIKADILDKYKAWLKSQYIIMLPGSEFYAGYKAALDAYDPDAIRRECVVAGELAVTAIKCRYESNVTGKRHSKEYIDGLQIAMRAYSSAILNAGKE